MQVLNKKSNYLRSCSGHPGNHAHVDAVRQSIKESAERARSTFKRRNDSIVGVGSSVALRPINEREASRGKRLPIPIQKTLNDAYAQVFERLLRVRNVKAIAFPSLSHTADSLISVQEAYTSCFDEQSKQSRNTTLALLVFLVENERFCYCANSCGLTRLMVKAASAQELASAASFGISPFSMQVDDVCHEQIRLLWQILVCMCEQSPGSRTEILGSGFMEVILQYIQLGSQGKPVCTLWLFSTWSPNIASSRFFECRYLDAGIHRNCMLCGGKP